MNGLNGRGYSVGDDAGQLAVSLHSTRQVLDYQVEMIANNAVGGLLPFRYMVIDGKPNFTYDTDGLVALDAYIRERGQSVRLLAETLMEISVTINGLDKYLLESKCLLLEPGFIFINPQRRGVFLVYLPAEPPEDAGSAFTQLVMTLVGGYRPEDATGKLYCRRIIEEVKKPGFKYEAFTDFLLDILCFSDGGGDDGRYAGEREAAYIEGVRLRQAERPLLCAEGPQPESDFTRLRLPALASAAVVVSYFIAASFIPQGGPDGAAFHAAALVAALGAEALLFMRFINGKRPEKTPGAAAGGVVKNRGGINGAVRAAGAAAGGAAKNRGGINGAVQTAGAMRSGAAYVGAASEHEINGNLWENSMPAGEVEEDIIEACADALDDVPDEAARDESAYTGLEDPEYGYTSSHKNVDAGTDDAEYGYTSSYANADAGLEDPEYGYTARDEYADIASDDPEYGYTARDEYADKASDDPEYGYASTYENADAASDDPEYGDAALDKYAGATPDDPAFGSVKTCADDLPEASVCGYMDAPPDSPAYEYSKAHMRAPLYGPAGAPDAQDDGGYETMVLADVKRIGAKLWIKDDGREYGVTLHDGGFVIGRRREYADLTLKNQAVGKIHARIFMENGYWYVKDINSRNGTYINNIRLEDGGVRQLKTFDMITIANVDMLFSTV